MIDKLRSMAIFSAVVDHGSFRGAAEHLKLAPSRVSQTVSNLERDLGVTLLYRSTRQISLTNEGSVLIEKVREMLVAAESGLDALNSLADQPTGELRITAPAFVMQTGLMDTITKFNKQYPDIILRINFSDITRDLIKEGFDVGIRAGALKDSEHLARNIGSTRRLLVASPEYVAAKQIPAHPDELKTWSMLHFSQRPPNIPLVSDQGDVTTVACDYLIEVDSVHALYEFAIRGLGITPLPENLARRGIDDGELVQVLPDWSLTPLALTAFWPDQSRRESLALMFVRFLAERADNV